MPQKIVAIDLVISERDPLESEIIEFEAVEIAEGGPGQRFYSLACPTKPLPLRLEKWTGITNAQLSGKRREKDVLADFLAFVRGKCIIIHDGREKLDVLSFKAKGNLSDAVFDTADLARILAPTQITFDLAPLAHRLGVTYEGPSGLATRAGLTAALWRRLLKDVADLSLPVVTAVNEIIPDRHPLKPIFAAAHSQALAKSFGLTKRAMHDVFRDFSKIVPEATPSDLSGPFDPIDSDEVAAIFDEGGVFARTMPFYERRPEQIEMVRTVCQALNRGAHLFIEAGTGTGKSLAYLVPAIYWAKKNQQKVIVSTNTKNLQTQIYFKDLPFLHETLPIGCKTALLKGRRNYLCIRKFLHLLRDYERELDAEERVALLPVITWAALTDTGDISENVAFTWWGSDTLWEKLSSDGKECPGRACREYRRCFVRKARALAVSADLVVANHSVVFSELGLEQGTVLPPYPVIIFDEAHNLENAATEHFSRQLYAWRVFRVIHRLHRARKDGTGTGLFTNIRYQISRSACRSWPAAQAAEQRIQTVIGFFPELGKATESFFDAIGGLFEGTSEDKVRFKADSRLPAQWKELTKQKKSLIAHLGRLATALEDLIKLLADLEEDLEDGRDFQRDLQFQIDLLRELMTDIDFVFKADEPNYVYWAGCRPSPGRHTQYDMCAAPLDISVMMRQFFFEPKHSVILSSATLSVNGRFDFMMERLGAVGLPRGRVMSKDVGSSFDFENQALVCIPTFLPEPRESGGAFEHQLTELLAEIFIASNGRGMALFTSYDMLNTVYPRVRERLEAENITVLGQGKDGSRDAITALFQRDITSVLLATQSFWEGVDFAGETLSLLVIAKLPFHVPTEPVVKARCEILQERGQDPFLHYTLPSAVIRLKQGFGRLIRTRTDRGVVVIADRRILTQRYGQSFLRSIPAPHKAFADKEALLNAVREFLGTE